MPLHKSFLLAECILHIHNMDVIEAEAHMATPTVELHSAEDVT